MANKPKDTMKELREEAHKPLDRMARDIYLALVKNTPKKSGAASRGWTSPENISKEDFSAVITTNSVPYVPRLNEGWSRQAPAGYVERTVDQIVRRYNK